MKIILATNNAHKVREIKEILNQFEFITLREAGINHETIEDGTTFEENAIKKAKEIAQISGLPALADDSGLCVEALGGAPGVFSARYASKDDESNASDAANNLLLLKNMQNEKNRRAYYAASIALYFPDGRCLTAEGRLYGEIAYEKKGSGGFGYDTLFYLPDKKCNVAQLTEEEKNAISHRGEALRKLKELL